MPVSIHRIAARLSLIRLHDNTIRPLDPPSMLVIGGRYAYIAAHGSTAHREFPVPCLWGKVQAGASRIASWVGRSRDQLQKLRAAAAISARPLPAQVFSCRASQTAQARFRPEPCSNLIAPRRSQCIIARPREPNRSNNASSVMSLVVVLIRDRLDLLKTHLSARIDAEAMRPADDLAHCDSASMLVVLAKK
jgi:hypothetical protein